MEKKIEDLVDISHIRDVVVADMNALEIALDAIEEDSSVHPDILLDALLVCWEYDVSSLFKKTLRRKEKYFVDLSKKMAELNTQEYGEEEKK